MELKGTYLKMDYISDERSFISFMNEIKAYTEEHLTEKRFKHTLNVVREALLLAERYGLDEEDKRRTEIAAMFHDAVKQLPEEETDRLIEHYGLDSRYRGRRNISHGKLAAEVISDLFGVDDKEILNAISFHTTGREGMSLIEKIVFLADGIEPDRKFHGVDDIRRAAQADVDVACHMMLEGTLKFLENEGTDYIDADTAAAEKWFSELVSEKKGGKMESREMAMIAAKALDSKKGDDIMVINISSKSSIGDFMILASGSNERLVGALADEVEDELAKEGVIVRSIEGKKESGWILMDYGDIIVNILTAEMRDRYNIEKIWGDCEILRLED